MNYRITNISTYLYEILCEDTAGIVHSVYNRTINLMADGHLFSLQAKHTPFSPITLQTDQSENDFHKLPVVSGMPFCVRQKQFIFTCIDHDGKPVSFDFHSSRMTDCKLDASLSESELLYIRTLVRQIVHTSDTNGFAVIFRDSPASDHLFFSEYARSVILQARELLLSGKTDDAARTLSKLIGLGTGLTPCGDDFLCGVLAGLNLIKATTFYTPEFTNALIRTIKQNLTNTNDISRAFLLCAARGQFSQAVLDLANVNQTDLAEQNSDSEYQNSRTAFLSRAFHAIGHSSGIDTLCGIIFILELHEVPVF